MSDTGSRPVRRPFRFGVSPRLSGTRTDWQETARKAEALGYDVLLMGDHMGNAASPLPALLSAADATTTLRICPHVLAVDFRNPAILAKEAATIDVLTDGRFELGIGVGWPAGSDFAGDYDQAGIHVDRPSARVQRLGEALHILRAFLTDEKPIDFAGAHFHAAGLVPLPRPVQKPGPPIMVAGAGPRLLEVAARFADIINFAPRPPMVVRTATGSIGFGLTVADQVDLVRQAAKRAVPRSRVRDLQHQACGHGCSGPLGRYARVRRRIQHVT